MPVGRQLKSRTRLDQHCLVEVGRDQLESDRHPLRREGA
jgi:hypothetical protein